MPHEYRYKNPQQNINKPNLTNTQKKIINHGQEDYKENVRKG